MSNAHVGIATFCSPHCAGMNVLCFYSLTNNIKSLWMLRVKDLFYFLLSRTTWAACGDAEELIAAILSTETDPDMLTTAMYHSVILSSV